MRTPILLALWLVACDGETVKDSDTDTQSVLPGDDADGDGFAVADGDCDDSDASIHPDATEVWYDGLDQDCSGGSDWDQDADGADAAPAGSDCDDLDAAVFPGQIETCDGTDQDCDGATDEDAVDALWFYPDVDEDGYGDGEPFAACELPAQASVVDGDCDDTLAEVNPDAAEVCNGVDDDCSGYIDDDATDALPVYPDRDGDQYGDPGGLAYACALPEGYVEDATDCDDTDAIVYPGAVEICDEKDDDCDAAIDEDASDPSTWFADLDGDTYGDPANTSLGCTAPTGFIADGTDCNDGDASANPGATEVCDGIDNDCDGEVDTDASEALTWYPDVDGDGYGDSLSGTRSCDVIEGYLSTGGDCADADVAINPGALEYCDGDDNDCDGDIDEDDALDAQVWYQDIDGDGYGTPDATTIACRAPAGFAEAFTDCDDTNSTVNPGNREVCDLIDDDCDGAIDEADAADAKLRFTDVDGDGYGDPATGVTDCNAIEGRVEDGTDCDDADAAVNPLGTETQDLRDEDCDGLVDEDFILVGDVVVTEVARQPYAGGTGGALNADAQWFEVHNTTGYDIDLSTWYFKEQDGNAFYVEPSAAAIVPAGGYAVLCYGDPSFATAGCAYTWGDSTWGTGYYDGRFYFDREEDLIGMYLDGELMDEVHWTNDSVYGFWPSEARRTIQVDDDAMDILSNDDEAVWCLSDKADIYTKSAATFGPDYGTPEAANRSCD